MGERDRDARERAREDVSDLLLMRRIDVAVQQHDGYSRVALLANAHGHDLDGAGIERRFDLAVEEDALRYLEYIARRHRATRLYPAKQILVAWYVGPSDLEDVAKACRRDQSGACALAFENGIGRNRRAVERRRDLTRCSARDGEHLVDALEETLRTDRRARTATS